ncbi:hypothetical protein CAPN006_21630 [Capnocytophaga canimorsus]|nr:hypothetical protein CAPN006_21630 [Capnocytophaga canimorsus]
MPKEEPVVYVRDFDADKEEAQPNEKVTYKVTKYSQEKVTENDKKSIQWAIKIDGKQEVLKEKGEKLVLTIKEEWAGKEIIVMPFLVKPDEERVNKKTKVNHRGDGYFIYIVIRSYAPFETFGPFNEWYGDNRVHSLDKTASYRTLVSIAYHTKNKTTEAFGGHSRSHTVDGSKNAMSPTNVINRTKEGSNYIDVHSFGGNKAEKMLGMEVAPDINQFTKLVVRIGDLSQDHILHIKGTISGDDFPNQECFVYDKQGNTLWLGNFTTNGHRQLGPIFNLPKENETDININIDIRIKVNPLGIFLGVEQTNKIISIEEWNKNFE